MTQGSGFLGYLNSFHVKVHDFVQRLDEKASEDGARLALYSRDGLCPERACKVGKRQTLPCPAEQLPIMLRDTRAEYVVSSSVEVGEKAERR
jgi:hypothetical protein